jgi:hypothetical protein
MLAEPSAMRKTREGFRAFHGRPEVAATAIRNEESANRKCRKMRLSPIHSGH